MRTITDRQEQILRAVHHSFEGLTQAQAAAKLNISPSTVSFELNLMKKIIPQMFPILTSMEDKYTHYHDTEGWTATDIAEYFGVDAETVRRAVRRAHKKTGVKSQRKGRLSRYHPDIDADVKEQF